MCPAASSRRSAHHAEPALPGQGRGCGGVPPPSSQQVHQAAALANLCGAGAGEHSRHAGSGNAQLGKDRSCTYRPSFSSASARRWRTCDDAGRRVAHSIKVDLRTRCRAGRQDMSAA